MGDNELMNQLIKDRTSLQSEINELQSETLVQLEAALDSEAFKVFLVKVTELQQSLDPASPIASIVSQLPIIFAGLQQQVAAQLVTASPDAPAKVAE
jgi:hypothetical protein